MISDKMLMTLFDKLNNGSLSNLEDISSSSETAASDLSSISTVLGGLGDTASESGSLYAILKYIANKSTPVVNLISSPQTLTNAYADLGAEVACSGYSYLGIWIKCTVQDSTGISVKALAKHTAAGTEEYNLPIQTVSTTEIAVTPEIVTFPDGTNFLYLLVVNLFNVIPYVQFQVKFTTDGGDDATINTAYITRG